MSHSALTHRVGFLLYFVIVRARLYLHLCTVVVPAHIQHNVTDTDKIG
jgi:hypothetical protein